MAIDLKRDIECPYCKFLNEIDLEDYCTDISSDERGMGEELLYEIHVEEWECIKCGKSFDVKGYINEYPVDALNYDDLNIIKREGYPKTRKEAMKAVSEYFGMEIDEKFLSDNRESVALLRLRSASISLPKYGVNGKERDKSEWVYIDINEKIDSGLYGAIYYF